MLARFPHAWTIGADTTTVHKQQECLLVSGKKDRSLQLQKLLVHPFRPSMAVLWLIHGLFKMEYHRSAVLVKEQSAFQDRRNTGRTGGIFSIVGAAERTFHSHPLRHNDLSGVNPLEIYITVLFK